MRHITRHGLEQINGRERDGLEQINGRERDGLEQIKGRERDGLEQTKCRERDGLQQIKGRELDGLQQIKARERDGSTHKDSWISIVYSDHLNSIISTRSFQFEAVTQAKMRDRDIFIIMLH